MRNFHAERNNVATIGDVAREAGVARSTVSAVLTGRKYVSPEIRERVDAAISELNYTVSARARALATNRTMNIGLVVHFHEAEFAPALSTYITAISESAGNHGYRIMLLTGADAPEDIRRAIAEGVIDGLILLNVVEDDPRLAPIREARFAAVAIGMPSNTDGIDAVDLNFEEAARRIVQRVHEQGGKHIALLGWPQEVYDSGATYATRFRDVALASAQALGLPLDLYSLSVTPSEVREQLHALLSQGNHDALVVHNDAAIAMLPLALRDLPTPHPYVISLHSTELARLFQVPFDAVESEPELSSAAAVDLLVARLNDGDAPFARQLIDAVVREASAD